MSKSEDCANLSIAISAGEYWKIVLNEINRLLQKNRGNQFKACIEALDQLCERGAITQDELRDVSDACNAIFDAYREKVDSVTARNKVYSHFSNYAASASTGTTALSILSVAKSSFDQPIGNSLTGDQATPTAGSVVTSGVRVTPGSTGIGAVIGAVIGAAVGFAAGGPAGAAAGAGIGAAAGAGVGFCNENNI